MPSSVVENGQIKCPFNLRTNLPIILNPELVPGDQFYCQGCFRHCLLEYEENLRGAIDWSKQLYVATYISGFTETLQVTGVLPRGSAKSDPYLIVK